MPAGRVSGRVFKIERGPGGEKLAYVRMFSGTIRTRDRLRFSASPESSSREGKVTAIGVFERGTATSRASVSAGQIARLRGLDEIQIGDEIGEPSTSGHRSRSSLRRRWNRSSRPAGPPTGPRCTSPWGSSPSRIR